ncbi:MAG: GNAT family N-acetyltransferase [Alphaproteobacteria bacterium]|nr:GNAT family N-acetyltransferase [Alphaproteobacteria bacterium]
MSVTITNDVTLDDLRICFGGEFPDSKPVEYLQARINDKSVFVAKKDGVPAGFVIYCVWWGDCPFIELLKVRPEFQRDKIGTLLMRTAAQAIAAKGYKELISSSEVINNMGISFHLKQGFRKLNTLDLPHGEEQFFRIEIQAILDRQ